MHYINSFRWFRLIRIKGGPRHLYGQIYHKCTVENGVIYLVPFAPSLWPKPPISAEEPSMVYLVNHNGHNLECFDEHNPALIRANNDLNGGLENFPV